MMYAGDSVHVALQGRGHRDVLIRRRCGCVKDTMLTRYSPVAPTLGAEQKTDRRRTSSHETIQDCTFLVHEFGKKKSTKAAL
jgi:hypothetical protein